MTVRPPRFAEWLLTRALSETDREAAMGDMAEEFAARVERDGPKAARRWYRGQSRRSLTTRFRRDTSERERIGGFSLTGGLMKDVQHVIRGLLKAPAWSAIVILTLALGIGASTTIFSVVDGVMLRPLPYPDSDRIVGFSFVRPGGSGAAAVTPLTFQVPGTITPPASMRSP